MTALAIQIFSRFFSHGSNADILIGNNGDGSYHWVPRTDKNVCLQKDSQPPLPLYSDPMHAGYAENSGAALPLDSAEYNLALADVVRSAGTTAFYQNLAELLARLTGCRDHLVMRYTPFGKPTFLINEAVDEDTVRLYLDTLHAIDPLQKLSRKTRQPCVVSLRCLGEGAPADELYMVELFKSAFIFDELVILLPAPGGVSIAVCCERRSVKFSDADHRIVENILPVVASLHKLHVDRSFALATARDGSEEADGHNAFAILDQHGCVVHESACWRRLRLSTVQREAVFGSVAESACGETALHDDHVAYWEELATDFPLAPAGKILTIESRSAGPLQLTLDDGLETFRHRWSLTKREADIVRLILVGYPNAHIACSLGIGTGTVRNHRHRLYYKLDITTERELFSMFLSQIIGKEIAAPGPSLEPHVAQRGDVPA